MSSGARGGQPTLIENKLKFALKISVAFKLYGKIPIFGREIVEEIS
jgi:hypothetical protein